MQIPRRNRIGIAVALVLACTCFVLVASLVNPDTYPATQTVRSKPEYSKPSRTAVIPSPTPTVVNDPRP